MLVKKQSQIVRANFEAGTGCRGQGREQGRKQGQGDDCANLQDMELKEGREGTQQHGPGAILEGAIGSCRDPTVLLAT